MGHGKETPRQKMIGMMYLVLTALLALNVQKEVLNAFINIDEGMVKTIENFSKKNQLIYDDFGQKAAANPSKVKSWYDKALEVKKRADELYAMINKLKKEIVVLVDGPATAAIEGDKVSVKGINTKDNMDKPAQVMVGDNNNGQGKVLKAAMVEYREFLLSLVDPKSTLVREAIEKELDTEDPPSHEGQRHSWESEHFEHLPLAGVITIMSGLQANIRNAESEALRYLYTQIEAGSFNFNKLEPTVIPNSSYIISGNDYNAEVFIAASDTTMAPTVYVGAFDSVRQEDGVYKYEMKGNFETLEVKNGKGIYKRRTSGEGVQRWGGLIILKNLDGTETARPFRREYMVAQGMISVNPMKMNVFYLGVDNPVKITASGLPPEKVFATSTNGTITRQKDGTWVVKPRTIGNNMIEVIGELDGKKSSLGYDEFRVKNVPDPVAKVNNSKGGMIDKNVLLAQFGVIADMENFDFDLEFKVTEFTVAAVVRGFTKEVPTKGNKFTDEQKELIRALNKGNSMYIQDVRAVGPDGTVRRLNTINFKLN